MNKVLNSRNSGRTFQVMETKCANAQRSRSMWWLWGTGHWFCCCRSWVGGIHWPSIPAFFPASLLLQLGLEVKHILIFLSTGTGAAQGTCFARAAGGKGGVLLKPITWSWFHRQKTGRGRGILTAQFWCVASESGSWEQREPFPADFPGLLRLSLTTDLLLFL